MSLREATRHRALDPGVTDASAPILVAGAGIGGLAVALEFARRGIPSTVAERRSVFEPEGAGIQIGPNGMRILDEIGVKDALEPLAGKPDAIAVRDATTGRLLTRLPLGAWIDQRHGAPYWVLHRADLHAALLGAVRKSPLVVLHTGFDIVSAATGEHGVALTEREGRTLSGRGLVVADGLRSRLRDEMFRAAPLRFAGRSAARAVITADEMPKALRGNVVGLWMHPRAHVVHYPVRGGREFALVFVRRDTQQSDDWSTAIPADWVTRTAEDFCSPLRDLLSAPAAWKKWALYELDPLPRWTAGPVALLGDAAHPTLPFLAQGAVLALEDAAVLARLVEQTPGDPAQAFAAYERERMKRATRVVEAARSNGRIYHAEGAVVMARNAALSLTPAALLMKRYDFVYGWRP